jgi:predicted DNA-binding transcriptional regulator YafY
MARGEQLTRQVRLLKHLEGLRYGATLKELCDRLDASRSTIHRDLSLLRDVGFPLVADALARGEKRWRLEQLTPGLAFTWSEALALYLGRELLQVMAGTDLATATEAAFAKIHRMLDPTALAYFGRLPSLVYVKSRPLPGDGDDRADVLDTLMVACEDQCAVRIRYCRPGPKPVFTVEIHPYGLVGHESSWYAIAFCPSLDEIRHYKIDRVREADVLGTRFEKPSGFSPEAHLRDSFGIFQPEKLVRVKVRIHPPLAATAAESR